MSRAVSNNAKVVVGSVVNGLSLSMFRRGYAAATMSAREGSRLSLVGKAEERAVIKEDSRASAAAWAPDPVTGYYRPPSHAAEIDPAELREMMLNHRGRSQ